MVNMIRKFFVIVLAVFLLPAEASVAQTLKYTDHEPFGGVRSADMEVQAAWVKEQENKGIKDAGEVMEKIRVIMNEP